MIETYTMIMHVNYDMLLNMPYMSNTSDIIVGACLEES